MIILEICEKKPFDIIAMTPRGILGWCCVHIAQLMTHYLHIIVYLTSMLQASRHTAEVN